MISSDSSLTDATFWLLITPHLPTQRALALEPFATIERSRSSFRIDPLFLDDASLPPQSDDSRREIGIRAVNQFADVPLAPLKELINPAEFVDQVDWVLMQDRSTKRTSHRLNSALKLSNTIERRIFTQKLCVPELDGHENRSRALSISLPGRVALRRILEEKRLLPFRSSNQQCSHRNIRYN